MCLCVRAQTILIETSRNKGLWYTLKMLHFDRDAFHSSMVLSLKIHPKANLLLARVVFPYVFEKFISKTAKFVKCLFERNDLTRARI